MYDDRQLAAFALYRLITILFALTIGVVVLHGGLRVALPKWAVVALAMAVPLIAAVLAGNLTNVDTENFRYTASLVRHGRYVYDAPWTTPFFPFHPYLPFQMFVVAIADLIADATGAPFPILLKLPTICAIGVTTYLLRSALDRTTDAGTASLASLAFAINPVLLWITAFHGQFDAIPAMFAFAAWFALRFRSGSRSEIVSAALLGAAILSKNWPLMLVPILAFDLRADVFRATRYVAVTLAVPVVASLAYVAALGDSPARLVRTIRAYHGVFGLSGYSRIVRHLPGNAGDAARRTVWVVDHGPQALVVALLIVTVVVLLRRGDPPMRRAGLAPQATTLLLAFYVFSPATSEQYYVWILPFAAVSGQMLPLAVFSLLIGGGDCVIYCDNRGFFWGLPQTYIDHAWVVAAMAWVFTVSWLGWTILSPPASVGPDAHTGVPSAS